MPRGKTEATKLKMAVREIMRKEVGYKAVIAYQAETYEKAHAKGHAKKPLEESLREHIGKAIDRIDPLEAASIAGLTVLLQPVVYNVDTFVTNYTNIVTKTVSGFANQIQGKAIGNQQQLSGGGFQLASGLTGIFQFIPVIGSLFGKEFNQATAALDKASAQSLNEPQSTQEIFSGFDTKTIYSYIFAFVIAFFIVRHGAEILKSLGGVSGAVGLLAGAV